MTNLKPMLAGKFKAEKVEAQLPVYLQPKLDGIRCLIVNGVPLSRTLKVIPNRYIQEQVAKYGQYLEGFDGELIVGPPTAKDAYRRTNSAVMSHDGEPEFILHVFDLWNLTDVPFVDRALEMGTYIHLWNKEEFPRIPWLTFVELKLCDTMDEILDYERGLLELGHEGAIIRGPNTTYKFGRATANQGQLIKLKRFIDAEATVIGFEELMHNANEATTDNLGHTVHSSHKSNMIPMGTLGALVCCVPIPGNQDGETWDFKIGTGFEAQERQDIWDNRDNLLAYTVKFKYFGGGIKDAPRFPVFLGWRTQEDMQ